MLATLVLPVAIETLGAMGKRSLAFVRELGHRVMQSTGEVKARTYLLQRLSVALQRGNAVSVMGVGGEPVRPGPAGCVSVLYLIYYFLFYYCIFILFIIIVCFVFCFVNSLSVCFFFGVCLFWFVTY